MNYPVKNVEGRVEVERMTLWCLPDEVRMIQPAKNFFVSFPDGRRKLFRTNWQ